MLFIVENTQVDLAGPGVHVRVHELEADSLPQEIRWAGSGSAEAMREDRCQLEEQGFAQAYRFVDYILFSFYAFSKENICDRFSRTTDETVGECIKE